MDTKKPATATEQTPSERYLSPDDAAAVIGLTTPRTLAAWRLRRQGPPYVRLSGTLVRYPEARLRAWIESRAVVPEAPLPVVMS